jgi:hypothetical protein
MGDPQLDGRIKPGLIVAGLATRYDFFYYRLFSFLFETFRPFSFTMQDSKDLHRVFNHAVRDNERCASDHKLSGSRDPPGSASMWVVRQHLHSDPYTL